MFLSTMPECRTRTTPRSRHPRSTEPNSWRLLKRHIHYLYFVFSVEPNLSEKLLRICNVVDQIGKSAVREPNPARLGILSGLRGIFLNITTSTYVSSNKVIFSYRVQLILKRLVDKKFAQPCYRVFYFNNFMVISDHEH